MTGAKLIQKDKMIWSVDLKKDQAEESARYLRDRGFSARIVRRLVRAEGVDVIGFVVVTDKAAAVRGAKGGAP